MTAFLERAEQLATGLSRDVDVDVADVRVVRAPYRFCPVGAHVDHQDGRVTGIALDRALWLTFVPAERPELTLRSVGREDVVSFALDDVPAHAPGGWGDYARGAVRALSRSHTLQRGILGVVEGEMSPGGVSTSAALGVACLLALETANGLSLDPVENVVLDRAIENDYLGLANGILDQSVILRARAAKLFDLDCRTGESSWHEAPSTLGEPIWLAVYSGIERALTGTSYNRRVDECRDAAAELMARLGHSPTRRPVLRDVPAPVTDELLATLPPALEARARHYFGEMSRVSRGVDAWRSGDLARFGAILTETCESSIHNYACGSPELIQLFELLASERGVLGARFSGAGFRGYAVALVDAAQAGHLDRLIESVRARYVADHPQLAASFHAHACRWADGAEVLDPSGAG